MDPFGASVSAAMSDVVRARIHRLLEDHTVSNKTRGARSHLSLRLQSGCRLVTWFFGGPGRPASLTSAAHHVAILGALLTDEVT